MVIRCSFNFRPTDYRLSSGVAQNVLDILRRKVNALEEENVALRVEQDQLNVETDNYSQREVHLVGSVMAEMAVGKDTIAILREEMTATLSENVELQDRLAEMIETMQRLHSRVEKVRTWNKLSYIELM